jgi:hypothetical protein
MKAYGGVDVYIHIFLTSAQAESELSASRPGRFTPGERTPCRLGEPRACLDNVEKLLGLTGTRTPTLRSSSPWPVVIPTCPGSLLTYNSENILGVTSFSDEACFPLSAYIITQNSHVWSAFNAREVMENNMVRSIIKAGS